MVNTDDLQAQASVLEQKVGLNARKPGQSRKKVACLSCGKPGVYVQVGPNRTPAWICTDYPGCESYVGCHPGSENALGNLAGPELRAARMRLHGWIDRLWRGKTSPTRKEVYQVLSQVAGVKHFHVAQSDLAMAQKLEARRAEVERACGQLPQSSCLNPAEAVQGLAQGTPPTGDLASQIDQTLMLALFGDTARRRWPTDAGGQFAAKRCLHLGVAHSYIDGAGRRWISKTALPSK